MSEQPLPQNDVGRGPAPLTSVQELQAALHDLAKAFEAPQSAEDEASAFARLSTISNCICRLSDLLYSNAAVQLIVVEAGSPSSSNPSLDQILAGWLHGIQESPQLLAHDLPRVLRDLSAGIQQLVGAAQSVSPEPCAIFATMCSALVPTVASAVLAFLAWAKVSFADERADLSPARPLLEAAAAAVPAAMAALQVAQGKALAVLATFCADASESWPDQQQHAAGQGPMPTGRDQAGPWLEASSKLRRDAWTVLQLLASAWSAAAACFGSVGSALGTTRSEPAKQLARAMHASGLAEALSGALLDTARINPQVVPFLGIAGIGLGLESLEGAPSIASCASCMLEGWSDLWQQLQEVCGGDSAAHDPVASIALSTFQGPWAVRLQALMAATALLACDGHRCSHGSSSGCGSDGRSASNSGDSADASDDEGDGDIDYCSASEGCMDDRHVDEGEEVPVAVCTAAHSQLPEVTHPWKQQQPGERGPQQEEEESREPSIRVVPAAAHQLWLDGQLSSPTKRLLCLVVPSPGDDAVLTMRAVVEAGDPCPCQAVPGLVRLDGLPLHDTLTHFLLRPLAMWAVEYRRCASRQGAEGRQQPQLPQPRAPPPRKALLVYLALLRMRHAGAWSCSLGLVHEGALQVLAVLKQQGDQGLLLDAAAQVAGAACCALSVAVDRWDVGGGGSGHAAGLPQGSSGSRAWGAMQASSSGGHIPDPPQGDSGQLKNLLGMGSRLLGAAAQALGAQDGATPDHPALKDLLRKLAQCSILPTLEHGLRLAATGGAPGEQQQQLLLQAVDGLLTLSGCGGLLAASTCSKPPCCNDRQQDQHTDTADGAAATGRWPTQRALGVLLTAVKLGRLCLAQLRQRGDSDAGSAVCMAAVLTQVLLHVFAPRPLSEQLAPCLHAQALLFNLWPVVAPLAGELCWQALDALTPPGGREGQEEQLSSAVNIKGCADHQRWTLAIGLLSTAAKAATFMQQYRTRLVSSDAPNGSPGGMQAAAGDGCGGSDSARSSSTTAELQGRARAALLALQVPRLLRAAVRYLEAAPQPGALYGASAAGADSVLVTLIRMHNDVVLEHDRPGCTAWLFKKQPLTDEHPAPRCGSSAGASTSASFASADMEAQPQGQPYGVSASGSKQPALLPALIKALKRHHMPVQQLEDASKTLSPGGAVGSLVRQVRAVWQGLLVERRPLPSLELLASSCTRPRMCCNDACRNFLGASEQDLSLRVCAGCCAVRYCSVRCQVQHWESGHRQQCAAAAHDLRKKGA